MNAIKTKLVTIMIIALSAIVMTGCYNVPVTKVDEPNQPVVSNIAKYQAPERSIAPEPQESTGVG